MKIQNGDFVETYNGDIYSCMIIDNEPVGFGLDSSSFQPFNHSQSKKFEPRFVYRPSHVAYCNPFRFDKINCKRFCVTCTIKFQEGDCVKTGDGIYLRTNSIYIPLNTTVPYRGEITRVYRNYGTVADLLKEPINYVVSIEKEYTLYD